MKKFVTITLVMLFVLGLMAGMATASDPEPPNWLVEGVWEITTSYSNTTSLRYLIVTEQLNNGYFNGTLGQALDNQVGNIEGWVHGDEVFFKYTHMAGIDNYNPEYWSTREGTIAACGMSMSGPNSGDFETSSGTKGTWNAIGQAIYIDPDGSYPAAPAIANELLKDAGIRARYGERNTGGNYIADVANHMDDNERFNGVSKYNKEAYRAQIIAFLIGKGAGLLPDGQVLWLDAANYSNGIWTDKSGEGNNASINGDPEVNELNGMPAVGFDGKNDYFTFPNPSIGDNSNYTIFVVATFRGVSENDDRASFVYTGHIGGQLLGVRKTGEIYGQHAYMRYEHDGLSAKTIWGPSTDVTNTSNVFTATYNDGDVIMYLNSVAGNLYSKVGFTSEDIWRIGSQANRRYLDGDIAEIIIYNHALSNEDREVVEEYLSAKYGL